MQGITYKTVFLTLLFRLATCDLNQEKFPDDFMFGVGSSAYQIEGAWNSSGKGESIWDFWTHNEEAFVLDLSNADISSDSYYKLDEDIQLLKNLGVDLYRFSISWTRIFPSGLTNQANEEGIEYYSSLIKKLKENDVKAMVVLFNWDMPKALHLIGGFANEVNIQFYVDYAKFVLHSLGDSVQYWLTFHDPIDICTQNGWSSGIEEYICVHNILKAHAQIYHYYRENTRFPGKISINFNSNWYEPKSREIRDLEASERMMQFMLGWVANPIYSSSGDYPEIMKTRIAENSDMVGMSKSRLPVFTNEEIRYIRRTADFFAFSHFTSFVAADVDTDDVEDGEALETSFMSDAEVNVTVDEYALMGSSEWQRVSPDGFRNVLNWIKTSYNVSEIYVTGNGYSDNGELEDDERIDYHLTYLSALLDAKFLDEVNVVSYTAWSFLDSFEWTEGYSHRFGLYHVDFDVDNRTRTPKSSTEVYKNIIEYRRLNYTIYNRNN